MSIDNGFIFQRGINVRPVIVSLTQLGLVDSQEPCACVQDADGSGLAATAASDPLAMWPAMLDFGGISVPIINNVSLREWAASGLEAVSKNTAYIFTLAGL